MDGYNHIEYKNCNEIKTVDEQGFQYIIRKSNYILGRKPHKFMRNPYANYNLKKFFDVYFPDFELLTEEYLSAKQEIYFICKKHKEKGIQHRCFSNMLHANRGCHYCNVETNDKKVKTEIILDRCKELNLTYVNRYVKDYETYVEYVCPVHKDKGVSCISWYHLKTCMIGCPYCIGRYKTTDDFKKEMELINPYIMIIGEYSGSEQHIDCKCKICGLQWSPIARSLKNKEGCPSCNSSKGEQRIKNFLKDNNIQFIQEHTFDNCVSKCKLRFDFYIPKINTIIEYDGQHHFFPVDFAGNGKEWADKKFKETQKRDEIKNLYCKNNKIHIIRIPYFEFENIEKILTPFCKEFLLCKNP